MHRQQQPKNKPTDHQNNFHQLAKKAHSNSIIAAASRSNLARGSRRLHRRANVRCAPRTAARSRPDTRPRAARSLRRPASQCGAQRQARQQASTAGRYQPSEPIKATNTNQRSSNQAISPKTQANRANQNQNQPKIKHNQQRPSNIAEDTSQQSQSKPRIKSEGREAQRTALQRQLAQLRDGVDGLHTISAERGDQRVRRQVTP